MNRLILLIVLVLTGCGGNQTQPQPGSDTAGGGTIQAGEGDYESLSGLTLDSALVTAIPLLSAEPGIQSRERFAAALDQKWNLVCEQTCQIKRK